MHSPSGERSQVRKLAPQEPGEMKMSNASISEIKNEITDRLSPEALAHWNGMCGEGRNEIIVMAQRSGVDAAAAEVESWTK